MTGRSGMAAARVMSGLGDASGLLVGISRTGVSLTELGVGIPGSEHASTAIIRVTAMDTLLMVVVLEII